MAGVTDPPGTHVDLADPAVWQDPYPHWAALRAAAPLAPDPVDPHAFVLTRFEECDAVLRDPRWSSNPAHAVAQGAPPGFVANVAASEFNVMLFMDPPDHTRLRRLVSRAFTPKRVEELRPRIEQIVADCLDRAEEQGSFDVVADLGYVVPVTVICELLGVPAEDHHLFGPWSSDATRLLDGVEDTELFERGLAGFVQILGYLDPLFEQRRRDPGDDLLSALVQAEEDGDRLTESELRAMTVLLFIAGHETTMNLIGNGTWALLRNRAQWQRLVADPTLIGSAVEELLRFDGPVHLTGRTATVDGLEVGGRTFAAGERVMTVIAAANRDPARFTDPDRLDIGREGPGHLAFGFGIHHCLGAALARLEGQITIGALTRRFPDLEVETDPVRYRDHRVLRGLQELRVGR